MRRISLCTLTLLFMSAVLFARWDDCAFRGLFPFWVNAGDFYTLLVFINGDEASGDIIHIRFCDENGHWCSDTTADMFGIRDREMLAFTTKPKSYEPRLPQWIPTTASYGYVKFRAADAWEDIHAWALIISDLSGAAMVVPAYDQDNGF